MQMFQPSGSDHASNAPWDKLYRFLLTCSAESGYQDYVKRILTECYAYIPYDTATAYFYDGNGKIKSRYTTHDFAESKSWFNAYQQYYSKFSKERGGHPSPSVMREDSFLLKNTPVLLSDWLHAPASEFKNEYISPRRICYSMSIILFDLMGTQRATLMLDRTQDVPFTAAEIRFMELAYPILNNMNKHIYDRISARKEASAETFADFGLTQRETEIALLLCHGFKPENIASRAHISLSTAYKHIAHIYQKMQVTSRQEFLVKALQK